MSQPLKFFLAVASLLCLIGVKVCKMPTTPAYFLESRGLKSLVTPHPDGMITAGPSSYRSPKEEAPVVSNHKKEIEKAQNLIKSKDNTSAAETEHQEHLTQQRKELIAKKSQQYQSASSKPEQRSDPKDQNAEMEKLQDKFRHAYDRIKELELKHKLAFQEEPNEVLHRESTKRDFEPTEVNAPTYPTDSSPLYKEEMTSTQQKRKEMMPQEPSLPPNKDYYHVDMSASNRPCETPQRPQLAQDDACTSCSLNENEMFYHNFQSDPNPCDYEAPPPCMPCFQNDVEILCVDPCQVEAQDISCHSLYDPCPYFSTPSKIIPVARVSYYYFTSNKLCTIYGNGAVFYQGELNQQILRNYYIWVDGGYMTKDGNSIGEGCSTTMRMVPASIGIKYMRYIQNCLRAYAGIGMRYFFLTIHDDSEFVQQKITEHGFGGVLTAGIIYRLPYCIEFNPFIEYSFRRLSFSPSSSDKERNISGSGTQFSGVSLGAGLGYSF